MSTPSTAYTLYEHLRGSHSARAFSNANIRTRGPESFTSIISVYRCAVDLFTDPSMRVEDAIRDRLRDACAVSWPNQPGGIDVRLQYAQALAVMDATAEQPELHAERLRRLAIFARYASSLPIRLQTAQPSLKRTEASLAAPTAEPDTRTTAELMQAATTASLAQPQRVQWSELAVLPLRDLLYSAASAVSGHGSLTDPSAQDTVWQRTARRGVLHTIRQSGELHGHAYAMRIVLWLVVQFWAAMVWGGACVVCGCEFGSWHQHSWLEQVPNTCTETIAQLIDNWPGFDSDCLLYLLPYLTLCCTGGTTCCGRWHTGMRRLLFGSALAAPALPPSEACAKMLRTPEETAQLTKALVTPVSTAASSPATSPASSSPPTRKRQRTAESSGKEESAAEQAPAEEAAAAEASPAAKVKGTRRPRGEKCAKHVKSRMLCPADCQYKAAEEEAAMEKRQREARWMQLGKQVEELKQSGQMAGHMWTFLLDKEEEKKDEEEEEEEEEAQEEPAEEEEED